VATALVKATASHPVHLSKLKRTDHEGTCYSNEALESAPRIDRFRRGDGVLPLLAARAHLRARESPLRAQEESSRGT